MIRLWIVSVMIATNGLYLAYESVDTLMTDPLKGEQSSIWTDTSNQVSLLSHHSTSFLDFKSDDNSDTKHITKDSYWRILAKKRGTFATNPLNKEALSYCHSLYLTSVIVVSLLALNRYKQNHKFVSKSGNDLDIKTHSKLHKVNNYVSDIEISLYCLLPLRTMSRIWGRINSIDLPKPMRKVVINGYAKCFGCNLDECLDQDLTHYTNLGQFFRRKLRPGVRPIDPRNGVVSPADGTVLHFGRITNGRVEQVKGITYSLSKFLGPQNTYQTPTPTLYEYQQNLLQHNTGANQTALYSCVIYLSPGDYHRFHSPAQWSVDFRRHFAGHLLSVNPGVVQVFPQLFTINERVVYSGNWRYGYFSMAAVGATAVGTVRVYFDEDLVTNEKHWTAGEYHDRVLTDRVDMSRGQAFGEFNLGSTIVLIFEAPVGLEFNIKAGQRLKYGQLLATI